MKLRMEKSGTRKCFPRSLFLSDRRAKKAHRFADAYNVLRYTEGSGKENGAEPVVYAILCIAQNSRTFSTHGVNTEQVNTHSQSALTFLLNVGPHKICTWITKYARKWRENEAAKSVPIYRLPDCSLIFFSLSFCSVSTRALHHAVGSVLCSHASSIFSLQPVQFFHPRRRHCVHLANECEECQLSVHLQTSVLACLANLLFFQCHSGCTTTNQIRYEDYPLQIQMEKNWMALITHKWHGRQQWFEWCRWW